MSLNLTKRVNVFNEDEVKGAKLFKDILLNYDGYTFVHQIQKFIFNMPDLIRLSGLKPYSDNQLNKLIEEYNNFSRRNKNIKWIGILNEIFSIFPENVKKLYIQEAKEMEKKKTIKKQIQFLLINNNINKQEFFTFHTLDDETSKLDYLYEILPRNQYNKFIKIY